LEATKIGGGTIDDSMPGKSNSVPEVALVDRLFKNFRRNGEGLDLKSESADMTVGKRKVAFSLIV